MNQDIDVRSYFIKKAPKFGQDTMGGHPRKNDPLVSVEEYREKH